MYVWEDAGALKSQKASETLEAVMSTRCVCWKQVWVPKNSKFTYLLNHPSSLRK